MLCLSPGLTPNLSEEKLRQVAVATTRFDKTGKTTGVTI